MVFDLIDDERKQWNKQFVEYIFPQVVAEEVFQIPLREVECLNQVIWRHTIEVFTQFDRLQIQDEKS